MQTDYTISEDLQYQLHRFFNSHNIMLLKENLRRLLVDFLDYDLSTGVPLYFDSFFYPFNSLLDVLETAASELQQHEALEKEKGQLEPMKTTPLEKVVAFIKAGINPEKIFLLHSAEKKGQEFFDLLVVVPSNSNTPFSSYEQVITMANIEHTIINVSLHKADVIEQQLQQGHIYYSLACNKQNLLFDAVATGLPEPDKAAMQALVAKAKKDFFRSHKKAESFLQGAANYVGENDKEMAAFMLQQVVELTVRGLITALSSTCIKTHHFNELKKPLQRYVPQLPYILSEEEAEENRLLGLLERAYLEARYANNFTIAGNDLTLLTQGAEDLHERAKIIFEQKLAVIMEVNV